MCKWNGKNGDDCGGTLTAELDALVKHFELHLQLIFQFVLLVVERLLDEHLGLGVLLLALVECGQLVLGRRHVVVAERELLFLLLLLLALSNRNALLEQLFVYIRLNRTTKSTQYLQTAV